MLHRTPARGRLPRALLAGGFVGLVLGLAPAAGQTTQGPTQGPGQAASKFYIAVAVEGKADKKEADDAAKAIADLKGKGGDPAKAGGPAPAYPNPTVKDGKPTTADLAAAAALLPVGLADQLAAGLALRRDEAEALPALYRWVGLTGARELNILGLDRAARTNPGQKVYWEGAEKARKEGAVYTHAALGWPIYSRGGEGDQLPEYFLLVRQPPADMLVTEKDLKEVRQISPPNSDIVLLFSDAGKEKLQKLTTAAAPGKDRPNRFMVLVVDGKVVQVLAVSEVIDTGKMLVGAGLLKRQQDTLFQILDQVVPVKSSTPN